MITWMQRHKKWLVITIWISTIAFVGAGFVGWGSYNYGQKGGVVAVVGDREISVEEYQREYSSLYEQYSQLFGGQFNQEMADKMNLRKSAYDMVIQKNLILSYADELGLDVTQEEVAYELVKVRAFSKDGKFDKPTYLKVLAQNGLKAADYEASIHRNLLLQKVQKLFAVNPKAIEIEALSQLMFAKDQISYKVLDGKDITISVNEEDLKKFWEPLKENYKSASSYELAIDSLDIAAQQHSAEDMRAHFDKFKLDFKKADGKLKSFEEAGADIQATLDNKAAKKDALKKYLKLKKGEASFAQTAVIYENKLSYSAENLEKIKTAVPGTILKPFKEGNSYITVQVKNIFPPKALAFEQAKELARADYIAQKRAEQLAINIQETLQSFEGASKAEVSRESVGVISGLTAQEEQSFLTQLLSSTLKEGSISLGEKAVAYKVNSSELASVEPTQVEAVKTTLAQLQNSELMNNLIKRLENSYEIESALEEENKDK